ncbi:MAG TPA: hypothetical protein VLC09_02275, partial [Polyangiaceae bacterium]|nr:hypothetical protein [Polyangiaceae bacterium]
MSTETLQLLGMIAGAVVLVTLGIAVARFFNSTNGIWSACAARFGLTFEERTDGTEPAQRFTKSLTGEIDGVHVQVSYAKREVDGARIRSTHVQVKALAPQAVRAAAVLRRGKGKGDLVVSTGDAAFDAIFALSSGTPELVRGLLTPPVRAALLRFPQVELGIVYDQGDITLSYADEPERQDDLDAPISAAVALAQVRW